MHRLSVHTSYSQREFSAFKGNFPVLLGLGRQNFACSTEAVRPFPVEAARCIQYGLVGSPLQEGVSTMDWHLRVQMLTVVAKIVVSVLRLSGRA